MGTYNISKGKHGQTSQIPSGVEFKQRSREEREKARMDYYKEFEAKMKPRGKKG